MTDPRRLLVGALVAGACRRAPPPPPPPQATSAPVAAVVQLDVVVPQRDVPDPDLAPEASAPPLAARPGPWRALPRVSLVGVAPLGRFEDAPDRDGDQRPDEVLAVHWNTIASRCVPVSATRPCPRGDPADRGPDARDGALTIAYLTRYSGDAQRDGPGVEVARLLGTRRVWRSSASPRTRLRGVEFTEFGGGLLARAVIEAVDGVGATDVIDVADLFVGEASERRAGAMVHHCRSTRGGEAERAGTLAIEDPSLLPLLYRVAMARPFSGCAAPLEPWERSVARASSADVRVRVTHDEPTRDHSPRVALALDPPRVVPRRAPDALNPLRANAFELLSIDRGCRWDRVRWRADLRRCAGLVRRDDPPVQGCAGPPDPLDPTRPEAIAMLPAEDGATLLFTRGQELLSVRLPDTCRRTVRLGEASAHRGPVPLGAASSPDGALTLYRHGFDLWLSRRDGDAPALLNGTGSGLPRGTIRALGFIGATEVAALISSRFVRFTVEGGAPPSDPPAELAETARALFSWPRGE